MKRTTFLTVSLSAAAVAVLPLAGSRAVVAAERVRTIERLGRGDRSTLVGAAGACASRRSRSELGGYTLADVV